MRPCAVRWSFLEGLQRLVLPGRPSKAGPSWKAFKGWSLLEGFTSALSSSSSSSTFTSFFYSLDWRLPLFFFPEPDLFCSPPSAGEGAAEARKEAEICHFNAQCFLFSKSLRSLVLPLGARPRPAVSSPTQSGLTVRNLHGVNDRILPCLPSCNVVQSPSPRPTAGPGPRLSLAITACSREAIYQCVREGVWRSGEERRREEEETQSETADEMRLDIQRDSPGQTSESFYLSSSCRYLQLGLALKTQIFALIFFSFFELPEGGCSCNSVSHPGPKVHILSSDGTNIDTIFIYGRDKSQTTTLPLSFFRRL